MVPPFACDPIDCSLVLFCIYNHTLMLLKAASFLQDKSCNIPLIKAGSKVSLVPRPSLSPVFDCSQCEGQHTASKKKTGGGEGLGTRMCRIQSQISSCSFLIDLCIECII